MHWSQTESSKCSCSFMFNHLAHPFKVREFASYHPPPWEKKDHSRNKVLRDLEFRLGYRVKLRRGG